MNSKIPNNASLISYLRMISSSMKKMGSLEGIYYHGIEDLVLQCGKDYIPQPLPEDLEHERGVMKECYKNAALFALGNPEYTYVEGYADMGVISVSHAWAVDKQGRVIELTWNKVGEAYRGIPFTESQLSTILLKKKVYGLLEDYSNGQPALTIKDFTPQKLADLYKNLKKKSPRKKSTSKGVSE